ncbi:putative Ras-related protein Rab-33 [Acanthaster planci]|uniref:Ras-related protein Rab-33 n=1 Tax=Acanthaster planci TaxID=133434 RepID=A0A8B7Z1S7_ACAPL|nr:putative Ras-related protein Rab-33 [Acanthaster planci]
MSGMDQQNEKQSASDSDDMDGFVAVEKQRRIFKIIVIGDSNVGKTCLTYRFCGGKFPEKTEATIGVDFREKNVTVDGETIKLQLWDTAGQERFRKSMVQHYYRNVHAVVFVYDMTKMSTFEGLPNWIDECDRHSLSPDIPRIMIGNKSDIEDKKVVATSIAQKFADANSMPLYETSAKMDEDAEKVDHIFMDLAVKLKSYRPSLPLPSHYGQKDKEESRSTVRLPSSPASQKKDSCCPCSS